MSEKFTIRSKIPEFTPIIADKIYAALAGNYKIDNERKENRGAYGFDIMDENGNKVWDNSYREFIESK